MDEQMNCLQQRASTVDTVKEIKHVIYVEKKQPGGQWKPLFDSCQQKICIAAFFPKNGTWSERVDRHQTSEKQTTSTKQLQLSEKPVTE